LKSVQRVSEDLLSLNLLLTVSTIPLSVESLLLYSFYFEVGVPLFGFLIIVEPMIGAVSGAIGIEATISYNSIVFANEFTLKVEFIPMTLNVGSLTMLMK
jgi:threonine/homoserine efflux transporter RhtA